MKTTLIVTIVLFSMLAGFASAQTPAVSTQAFPNVSPATQKARDDTREQILRAEMATSTAALAKAQAALATGPATDDKREAVARYLTDISALQRELKIVGTAQNAVLKQRTESVSSIPKPKAPDAGPVPFWDVFRRNTSLTQSNQEQ